MFLYFYMLIEKKEQSHPSPFGEENSLMIDLISLVTIYELLQSLNVHDLSDP